MKHTIVCISIKDSAAGVVLVCSTKKGKALTLLCSNNLSIILIMVLLTPGKSLLFHFKEKLELLPHMPLPTSQVAVYIHLFPESCMNLKLMFSLFAEYDEFTVKLTPDLLDIKYLHFNVLSHLTFL